MFQKTETLETKRGKEKESLSRWESRTDLQCRPYIYAVFIIKTFRNYTRTMVSFTITDHQSNIGPTKLN